MTGYDLFALAIVLFSALAGWVRGGAREVITFLSFILAAFVALIGLPLTGPLVRGMLDPGWSWVGTVLAVVVTFVVVYLGLRLLGAWTGRSLRASESLNGIDRATGVMFGLFRALMLLGVIHLVFYAATPAERMPGWFTRAAFHPVGASAARAIQWILPNIGRAADTVTPVVTDSVRRGASDAPQSDAISRSPEAGTAP